MYFEGIYFDDSLEFTRLIEHY